MAEADLIKRALDLVPGGATAQVDMPDGEVVGPYPILAMRHFEDVLGWLWTEDDERGFGIQIEDIRAGDDGEILVTDDRGWVATIWVMWDETNREQLREYLETPQPPLQIHGEGWSIYPGVERVYQP